MADTTGITSDGRSKVVIVPTLADPGHPTVTELNAVTAVDISCLITSDGLDQGTNEGVVADKRLCDTEDYERRGRVSHTLEVTYVRTKDSTTDKAFSTLVPGFQGYA